MEPAEQIARGVIFRPAIAARLGPAVRSTNKGLSYRHSPCFNAGVPATALLLIDLINAFDYEGGEAMRAATLKIVPAVARLARSARAAEVPVIYANDNFGKWRSDFRELVERLSAADHPAHEVVRPLIPGPDDYFILKPRHSAFYGTPLELFLHDLDVKRLVLAGIAADSCVLMTACDAHVRGFDVHVPADCVASPDQDDARQALELLARTASADLAHGERVAWARGH
jgi:nicotinamidase-related amidase